MTKMSMIFDEVSGTALLSQSLAREEDSIVLSVNLYHIWLPQNN